LWGPLGGLGGGKPREKIGGPKNGVLLKRNSIGQKNPFGKIGTLNWEIRVGEKGPNERTNAGLAANWLGKNWRLFEWK